MAYTEAQKRAIYKYQAKNAEKTREHNRKMSQLFRAKHRESYNIRQMELYYRKKLYLEEAKRLRNILFSI